MSLDAYALVTIDDVKGYLGSLPSRDGLWVYCSQAGATTATVEVTPTTMILVITGTGAGTNTLTFADANKNTVAELVTAINALTGWKAGAIYDGNADSTDLVITAAISCLGAAQELTLKIEDNYLIERLIDRATYFLERYCHRKFMSRAYSREVYYGSGHGNLILDQYPATTISRVSIGRTNAFSVTNTTATNHATVEITSSALKYSADGAAATSLTLASYATINLLIAALNLVAGWTATLLSSTHGTRKATDLLIRPGMYCKSPTSAWCEIPNDELTDYYLISPSEDRNYGILYCPGGWVRGQEYFVDYTAGYTTIPYALEEACILLVAYRYHQKDQDQAMKSESLGDYSYSLRDMTGAVPQDLKAEIDLYRKRTL